MQQLLISDIQTRLLAQVPALKYVDENWGQLDFFSNHPPVKFPCALIEVQDIQWGNVLKGAQMGVATIRVRVADLRLSNTSGAAPGSQKVAAALIHTTLAEVHRALHNWSGNQRYSRLIRTRNTRVAREDGSRLFDILYTCEVYEGVADMQTTPAVPAVTAT